MTFKNGDKVRLYGVKTNKGYYEVVLLQNFTRDFYVGTRPTNPDKAPKNKTSNKSDEIVLNVFAGVAGGIMGGPFIGIPVAFIAWGFYDAQFWKTFKITWLVTVIVATLIPILCYIIPKIIPKSESAKQKEKQQEERELNRRKEAWAIYQKVINDDDE